MLLELVRRARPAALVVAEYVGGSARNRPDPGGGAWTG